MRYVLGISSPVGCEYVSVTASKEEAEKWAMTPSDTANTMHVYGVLQETQAGPSCPTCLKRTRAICRSCGWEAE